MRLVSKRRLLSTTVGIILAVAIIFSIFTITNNAAKSEIYEDISHMPFHFTLTGELPVDNYTKAVNAMENLPHVSNISAYLFMPMWLDTNASDTFSVAYWNNINSTVSVIKGRLPESADEIDLSYWFASTANISVGSTLNVTKYVNDTPENISYRVVGIFYYHKVLYRADAIATSAGMMRYGHPDFFVAARVNTTYLLSSLDVDEINMKIWKVKMQVETIITEYGGQVITQGTGGYVPYLNVMQSMIYIIYALPIIVMGVYLSKVGIEIEMNERRREFGVMRVRGASRRDMIRLFLYELAIYSVLGGILGYILGEALAYAGNYFIYTLPYFVLDTGWIYALSGVLMAAMMFVVAFYFPWRKIKNATILDLLSHFSSEFGRVKYSPTKDLIYSLAMWIYMAAGLYIIENTSFNSGLNLLVILAALIALSFVFMLPLIMVLLPLYMVRLLTLGTQRVYHFILRPIVALFRVSRRIAEYAIERNPKNMAYVAFILAFVLTFSSLVAVTQDNEVMMQHITTVQRVGGDFQVNPTQFAGSLELVKTITHSTNQSAHVWIEEESGTVFGESLSIFLANFKNYTDTVYDVNMFLKDGGFRSGEAVVSSSLALKYRLRVGDSLAIRINSYNEMGLLNGSKLLTYTIGGIVYSFPGLTQGEDSVMIDSSVAPKNASLVIFRAKNYHALEQELAMSGLSYVSKENVRINQDALFFETAEMFLVVLGGAAIFVVNYSLYFNRRTEIALYRVRGASRSRIRRMLMAEGTAIILLSMLVGMVVGLAMAYFIIYFMYSSTSLPPIFVVGRSFWTVILVMFVVFMVVEYILSWIFSRTDPVEVIRSSGGEM